jgi:hypothetical protein
MAVNQFYPLVAHCKGKTCAEIAMCDWNARASARRPLMRGRFWIEFAQESREFFLLRFVESLKNFRYTSFKLGNGALVELGPLVREYDVNYATVSFIPFARHQFFVF